jgi:hypothetical protein
LKRRLFLRGIGGAALAAPLLFTLSRHGARAAAPAVAPIKRSVIFFTHYGCIVPRWYGKLRDRTGPIDASMFDDTLKPLSPHASKLLFPQRLAMFPRGNYISHSEPHDQATASILTCAPMTDGDVLYPRGRSIDWEIAKRINPPGASPLVLRIGEIFTGEGAVDPGLAIREYISYQAPQTPYTPETNPLNAYKALTGLRVGQETQAEYLVKQGQSIIDIVQDDLASMRRMPMSGQDQRKIDDWLGLLRETELSVVPLACNTEVAEALGVSEMSAATAKGPDPESQWKSGGDMMMKLIALSMMCDANRSIVLHWDGKVVFRWDGMDMTNTHHSLSHLDDGLGSTPEAVKAMVQQIDSWYAQRYARLVALIDSVTEGDGTMLDNSAVTWIPEMSDGNEHNRDDLPICVAGGLGGYLKQGYSVKLDSLSNDAVPDNGGHPLNRFYTTLLNGLGAIDPAAKPVQSFGLLDNNEYDPTAPSNVHILHPGEIDELKVG